MVAVSGIHASAYHERQKRSQYLPYRIREPVNRPYIGGMVQGMEKDAYQNE